MKNETIVVTGGASFIGSHLVERLIDMDAGKIIIADDLSSGNMQNLHDLDKRSDVEFRRVDLKYKVNAQEVIHDDVDRVFHLASDHGGRGYIANHPADCAANMLLDTNVFEVATHAGVDKITFASSACAYPTDIQKGKKRLKEDMISFDKRGGAFADETYGWSKLMGEMTLQAFHEQYGVDASSVRIFTAYGPRENETHAIIALIAKAYADMEPYTIWGNGEQTRNFTFVEDIVSALVLANEKISDGTAINAGIERYISINEVVDKIFDLMDKDLDLKYLEDKPVGVRHRAANLDRTRELLGWEPEYTLDEGLEKTISWYTYTKNKENVRNNLETLLHER